jgi:glycosyltransferase involved in cell wall biosynthesis
MSGRKKALIISYSNLNSDPRVLRQIEFIGQKFDIYTAGVTPSAHAYEKGFTPLLLSFTITFHMKFPSLIRKAFSLLLVYPIYIIANFYERAYQIYYLKWRKNFDQFYWTLHRRKSFEKLSKLDFDLIVANDITALPLAVKLKELKGAKIYYDAHEYAPLEYDNDPKWLKEKSPYFTYLSEKYIPFADYCTTIGQMIADKFLELTGKHFDVVYNAPVYYELPIVLQEDDVIRCVHHGVASPIRKIENMVDAFAQLGPKYELHLLLMNNDNEYYQWLIKTAEKYPNIYMHKPVPTKEIPRFINQFDITLNFIPPINFNYTCGLPNKFFESIQARIMLICGPLEEQRFLINKYGLGLVGNGFEYQDVIDVMKQVKKADIRQYKENADKAAHLLSAEKIMEQLVLKIDAIMA